MPRRGLKWTVARVYSAPAWWVPVTIGVATGPPQGVIWGCRKDVAGEEQGSRGPSPGRAEDNIMVESIVLRSKRPSRKCARCRLDFLRPFPVGSS